MWRLYCLPGRIITELGYLFPGRNQLWASKRRRESGFAAFIFATAFWAIMFVYAWPSIKATIDRSRQPPVSVSADAASYGSPNDEPARSSDGDLTEAKPPASATVRTKAPTFPSPAASEPTIVFGPRKEIVQPLPSTDGADTQN